MKADVKRFYRRLERAGFRVETGKTAGGGKGTHPRLYLADRFICTLTGTPSDWRWERNQTAYLREKGFDLNEMIESRFNQERAERMQRAANEAERHAARIQLVASESELNGGHDTVATVAPTKTWTIETIVQAGKDWTELHGRYPRSSDWIQRNDELMVNGVDFPRTHQIYRVLGQKSWGTYLDLLGVPKNERAAGGWAHAVRGVTREQFITGTLVPFYEEFGRLPFVRELNRRATENRRSLAAVAWLVEHNAPGEGVMRRLFTNGEGMRKAFDGYARSKAMRAQTNGLAHAPEVELPQIVRDDNGEPEGVENKLFPAPPLMDPRRLTIDVDLLDLDEVDRIGRALTDYAEQTRALQGTLQQLRAR